MCCDDWFEDDRPQGRLTLSNHLALSPWLLSVWSLAVGRSKLLRWESCPTTKWNATSPEPPVSARGSLKFLSCGKSSCKLQVSQHSPQSTWNTTSTRISSFWVLSWPRVCRGRSHGIESVAGNLAIWLPASWNQSLTYLTYLIIIIPIYPSQKTADQKLTSFVGHLTVKLGMVVDVAELDK